jgi:chitinase
VTITNPLDNATLSAPANVTIQASASDPDAGGSVTNVQFLVGSAVLTNQTTAPFSAATNNLAAGSYTLWAVASDNNGVKNTNAVTINVVTPVQTTLSGTAQMSSTNFQFSYSANVGLSYIVQRSTNLTEANWITLVTNVAGSNPVVFVDNHATNGTGFYRVGRLPNP